MTAGRSLQPLPCAIGAGVVAPNGIGDAFFEALAEGRSGIRSYNEIRQDAVRRFRALQPAFSRFVTKRYLPGHSLFAMASFASTKLSGFLETDVSAADMDRIVLEGTRTNWPLPVIAHQSANGQRFDAFGVVRSEELLPYLLPLTAAAIRDLAKRSPGGRDSHMWDLVFLTTPRVAKLALVSTYLGILEAAGQLDDFERGREALPPWDITDLDTLEPFVEAAEALFTHYLAEAHARLGIPVRRVGIVVGSAIASMEAMARCEVRYARYGLIGSPEPQMPAVQVERAAKGGYRLAVDFPEINSPIFFNDGQQVSLNYTAGLLARFFQLTGEQLSVSTGCCSGATAAITAARTIQTGSCEVMVATGVDCCTHTEIVVPFLAQGDLAAVPEDERDEDVVRPFDKGAFGWALAEGAGTIVLAGPQSGVSLGTGPRVVLCASAIRNTANDVVGPPPPERPPPEDVKLQLLEDIIAEAPDGRGLVLGYAMGDRWKDGRPGLDLVEARGVALAAQGRSDVWLASLKGLVGHSMSGSSMMPLAAAVRILAERFEGDQLNWLTKRNRLRFQCVVPDSDLGDLNVISPIRDLKGISWVLANGSGLGGTTCAILLAKQLDDG